MAYRACGVSKFVALVAAAGRGARLDDSAPKQHLDVGGGMSMLRWSVLALLADSRLGRVAMLVQPGDKLAAAVAESLRGNAEVRAVSCGADTRAGTIAAGLDWLDSCPDDTVVVVHDAARPCLHREDLAAVLDAAGRDEIGAMLATPVADTLKEVRSGRTHATCSREGLLAAQTPQCARLSILREALLAAGAFVTDEAQALEMAGHSLAVVEARHANPKVTTRKDLDLVRMLLASRMPR